MEPKTAVLNKCLQAFDFNRDFSETHIDFFSLIS